MLRLVFCFLFAGCALHLWAMAPSDLVRVIILNQDTILRYNLDPVEVTTERVFASRREARLFRRYEQEYARMVYNIKKVYPFSKVMRAELEVLNREYVKLKTNKERNQYMRRVEEELRERFENDLKKLTFRQGLILLKLIDRETDKSAFELIKDFRGGLTATFFQTFALLFKVNLKMEYDAKGEDRMMEEIIQLIEKGEI